MILLTQDSEQTHFQGTIGDDDPGKIPDPQTDGIDNDGDLIADEFEEKKMNQTNSIQSLHILMMCLLAYSRSRDYGYFFVHKQT